MRPPARTSHLLALLLASAASALGDDAENRKRLEAMPREQRVHLSQTIERFDALPAAERAAVRDLDTGLSKLDPEVQDRYRLLLRRYHVWVGGLDDSQKKQLAAASVDERLALVSKWRKAERDADTRARKNLVMGVHLGDLGTIPPFEMANALAVWFQLDDKEKAEVEKFEKIPRRVAALNKIGRERDPPVPKRHFPKKTEENLIGQLKNDDMVKAAFRNWLNEQQKAAESAAATKPEEAEKSAEPTNPKKKQDQGKGKSGLGKEANPLHPLSESLYFMRNPPAPVSADHLIQFEAQIPGWLRAPLDPLPPDDARRRLTILYRQIYPPGQEIPPPKQEPAKSKAAPKPSTPKTAPNPAAPF